MEKTTLESIKTKLLQEKEQLEKDLATFANKSAVVEGDYAARFPQYGSDEGENAAEVAAFGDRLSLERTLEEQLQDVNKALAHIADGSYGTCKYCKNPIEEQRLLARPTSTSCVACKKKLKGE